MIHDLKSLLICFSDDDDVGLHVLGCRVDIFFFSVSHKGYDVCVCEEGVSVGVCFLN